MLSSPWLIFSQRAHRRENNADVQAEIGSVIKNHPADTPLCTAAGGGVAGVAIVRCHVHPHLIISISTNQYFKHDWSVTLFPN